MRKSAYRPNAQVIFYKIKAFIYRYITGDWSLSIAKPSYLIKHYVSYSFWAY